MNVLCRGCRTELDLNASSCPICLRGRPPLEILEDAKRLREEQTAARRRPFVVLAALAAAAGVGSLVWQNRAPLRSAAQAVREKASDAMEQASDPRSYAPSQSKLPGSFAGIPLKPPAGNGGGPVAAPSSRAPGRTVEPPADWTLPEAAVPAAPGGILLRGWIYDLVSARPVPHATIVLRDRVSGGAVTLVSDQRGAYQVQVPRENSGLMPEASVAGYRRATLAEEDPAWHARGAAARRRAASREPDELLLTFSPRQEEAEINFVLVPAGRR